MRRLWNTLIHGDRKTKAYLWSILLLIVLALVFCVFIITTRSIHWLLGALFTLGVAAIIIKSITLREVEQEENASEQERVEENADRKADAELMGEAGSEPDRKTSRNTDKEANPISERAYGIEADGEAGREPDRKTSRNTDDETDSKKDGEIRKKADNRVQRENDRDKKKEISDKNKKNQQDSQNEDERSNQRNEEKGSEDKDAEDNDAEDNVEYIKTLNKKEINTILFRYKVKRVHFPILIDSCESRKLEQCPAYAWVNRGKLYILALERKARVIDIPLSRLQTMQLKRAVLANPEKDYAHIREGGFIAQVFRELIPSYYSVIEKGRRSQRKNCYILGEDIAITNRSAATLLNLVQARFVLQDEERRNQIYGTYATEAYKDKLLWQDEVIKTSEFKQRIRTLLQKMVEANISEDEFNHSLQLMVERQLVTEEYAKYYSEARKGQERR